MAAPLIVRTAEDVAAGIQEVTVLLHDFSFRDPMEILAGQTSGKDMKAGSAMPGMSMPGDASDLNDIEYDAYLANDRTLSDPSAVRVARGGRIRLRLINGATSTAFWIELGSLEGTVVAVDGNPVKPLQVKRIPMAQAQRVDVILTIPPDGGSFPVLAQREGDRRRTGIILATPGAAVARVPGDADEVAAAVDNSMEQRLQALAPLGTRGADVVHKVELSGAMTPYAWLMDGRTWADHKPLVVTKGQRVEMEVSNRSAMAHPMHLHGHHFQVTALNGAPLSGAVRDTVLVPANGSARVAFDADNPGRWLFHCHNLYHIAVGMMTEIRYDEASLEAGTSGRSAIAGTGTTSWTSFEVGYSVHPRTLRTRPDTLPEQLASVAVPEGPEGALDVAGVGDVEDGGNSCGRPAEADQASRPASPPWRVVEDVPEMAASALEADLARVTTP